MQECSHHVPFGGLSPKRTKSPPSKSCPRAANAVDLDYSPDVLQIVLLWTLDAVLFLAHAASRSAESSAVSEMLPKVKTEFVDEEWGEVAPQASCAMQNLRPQERQLMRPWLWDRLENQDVPGRFRSIFEAVRSVGRLRVDPFRFTWEGC